MTSYSSIEVNKENIPVKEFVEICTNAGIMNPTRQKVIRYFNDLRY